MNDDINNEPDISYKFILVGDSNVGKTCTFVKIAYGKFDQNTTPTIGVDYKNLNYEIEIEENSQKIKKKFKIKLFDSAGQDRFRALTKSYINGSDGIILVYDITKRESFDDVTEWIKSIEEEYGKIDEIKSYVFLIGNKKDLVEGEEGEKKRVVQTNEAKNLAEKYNIIWGDECSAKENTKNQFDQIFKNFAKIIFSKYGYKEQNRDTITLDNKNVKNKKKSCKC